MTVSILPLVIVGGEVIDEDHQEFSPQHINDNNDAAWDATGLGRNLQIIEFAGGLRRYRYLGCFDPTHIAKMGP